MSRVSSRPKERKSQLALASARSQLEGLSSTAGASSSPHNLAAPPPIPSFFQNANGFQIGELSVTVNTRAGLADSSRDGWELLGKNISHSALHNSSARYDAPKCDEGTRVEVVAETVKWIEDRNGPYSLLCLTGAAGSGKSSLQQTVAEICADKGILGSAFFFSASDSTRNTVEHVIPTIAYQLGSHNETLRGMIGAAVEVDRLIFTKSLRTQMSTLVVEPTQRYQGMGLDLSKLPYVILIDGLDECTNEGSQAELLTAFKECLVNDLPFRTAIFSRPERAIRTALEPGGQLCTLAYHIELSDKYDASGDMRRYLQRRFEVLGLRIGNPTWFSAENVETLVRAASGQFVYVVTAYRFISARPSSSAERLKTILSWIPQGQPMARPFEILDRVFTNILLTANNTHEAGGGPHEQNFLLLFMVFLASSHCGNFHLSGWSHDINFNQLLPILEFDDGQVSETLASDLHSLVLAHSNSLRLYHKSFADFLQEKSHSQSLFVSFSGIWKHLSKCSMQYISECQLDIDCHEWEAIPLNHQRALIQAVEGLPFFLGRAIAIDDEIVDFTQKGGWRKIDSLLLLFYRLEEWSFQGFEDWIAKLRQLANRLKARNPEAAAIVSQFAAEWELDGERRREWGEHSPVEVPTAPGNSWAQLVVLDSVPDWPLPVDMSTPQRYGSLLPIRQSQRENENIDLLPSSTLRQTLRPPHRYNLAALGPCGNPASFFPGASGVQMRDIQYFDASNVFVNAGHGGGWDGWELLLENIAPNALHDSQARSDAPKCNEDTRVEVVAESMEWCYASDHSPPQPVLCLTGAAGSGKSAVQQTIAERCLACGILGSTFFFSASDSTRNTVKQVIPTIAYQLGLKNDTLRWLIKAAVENDRLIFSKSLRTQMLALIVGPAQRLGMTPATTQVPYVVLIDGLDECKDEDRQAELLTAFKECLFVNNDLPFRTAISSRPEWAIRTALEPGGQLHELAYHIALSDKYDASADMRRYLLRRFLDIGRRISDPGWFTKEDINTLIRAASRQFVYVATVYKFISSLGYRRALMK